MTMAPTAKYRTTPTPNPSPQGGGEHTARAAPSLMLTRRSLLAVSAAAMLAGTRPARAEDWPQRSVRVIVPFGPGGGADIIGRIVAQSLQEKLGQPVVIENRPGAAGTLGNEAVARAEKDGYTLGIMTAGQIIAAVMNKSLRYDTLTAFDPVSQVATAGLIIVTRPNFPGYDVTTGYGVFGPRGMPREIIARLNKAINESLAEEAVQKRLTTAGVVVRGSTPEAFGEHMAREFARWNAVREAAGIPQQ